MFVPGAVIVAIADAFFLVAKLPFRTVKIIEAFTERIGLVAARLRLQNRQDHKKYPTGTLYGSHPLHVQSSSRYFQILAHSQV
jgi:hypothetical protein